MRKVTVSVFRRALLIKCDLGAPTVEPGAFGVHPRQTIRRNGVEPRRVA